MPQTIIEKYNNLQKEILHNFAIKWNNSNSTSNFRSDLKRFYKFEKEFGWNILLNAFYLIDDTEFAKESFMKFDLQGPSRHKDVGERYLRLYGFLNAVYLQKSAIENLIEIHKIENKSLIIKSLSETEILKLRNKIGAHSSNYLTNDNPEHRFDVFEISRAELQRNEIFLSRNQKAFKKYDLEKSIKEYNSQIEDILYTILKKVIQSIFNNEGEIFKKFEKINTQKKGGIFIRDIHVPFQNT